MRQQAVDDEPETVPKSFGCLPHKTLKLSLSRNSKSSRSSSISSGNLSSPIAAAARDLKSPSARSEINNGSNISNRRRMLNNNKEEEEEDQYREVFRRFDNAKDGKISAIGLRSYFASVGVYMSSEDAEAVISDVDSDGDKLIDFEDFLRFMKKKKNDDDDDDDDDQEEEVMKAAFEKFEMEKGCGRITPKSLQRTLSRLGDSKSYEECVGIIKVLDTEGKGEIGYPEFYSMMMHGLT